MDFPNIYGNGSNNAFLATAIGCLATGIKFTKEWYMQRRYILELANEKGRAELRGLKTTIHTQFLFQSLTSLEKSIANSAVESPGMVLQLSDLLSYMLYDCNADVVPLTKEIASVQEYILLEKIRTKDWLVIDLKTYGNTIDKAIVPAILLSFLQNCISLLSQKESEEATVFIEIGTEVSKLHFLLSVHSYKESMETTAWKEIITDLQLRLNKFYLSKHLLEILHKKEEILIEFSVILDKIVRPVITINEQIQTQTT